MDSAWRHYQEEAAAFFRGLGMQAETDVTIHGVRTSHDVDVCVTSHHAGFDITWLVECKLWATPVSKLHVLALREIVADTGADRGILLAESGFQSGALEAASLTNVQLTSLLLLRESASDAVLSMRMREIYDRNDLCRERYWRIPKDVRIEHGLRFDVGDWGYSGARVIEYVADVLSRAFRGSYSVESDAPLAALQPDLHLPERYANPAEIVAALEPLVADLEKRLAIYERHLLSDGHQ